MRFLLITLLLALPALAGPRTAAKTARSTKPVTLWGIRWYPTVDDAVVVASKNKKKPRAVLFMRVLGDLKGKT